MIVPILMLASDRYVEAVEPCLQLIRAYWSKDQPVIIGGCKPFATSSEVHWLNVHGYDADHWSNALIECLQQMTEDIFILFLEDCWLCRQVDTDTVELLADYMSTQSDILKIDLSTDRLLYIEAEEIGACGHCDLIEIPWGTHYQWSIQVAMWNRRHLLEYVIKDFSPWRFEQQHQRHAAGLRVLGTWQWPVRYVNAISRGEYLADVKELLPGDNYDKRYHARAGEERRAGAMAARSPGIGFVAKR